jgi:hypothetical protein
MRPTIRLVPASRPPPVSAVPELRDHVLAGGLAGKAVGDKRLEAVAHLDPGLALLDREQNQQPVVLALLADAAPAVFEQLQRILAEVGIGRQCLDGHDHDDIAAGRLERPDDAIHLEPALRVDDVREVVGRLGEYGEGRR